VYRARDSAASREQKAGPDRTRIMEATLAEAGIAPAVSLSRRRRVPNPNAFRCGVSARSGVTLRRGVGPILPLRALRHSGTVCGISLGIHRSRVDLTFASIATSRVVLFQQLSGAPDRTGLDPGCHLQQGVVMACLARVSKVLSPGADSTVESVRVQGVNEAVSIPNGSGTAAGPRPSCVSVPPVSPVSELAELSGDGVHA
jgi:hypothetical protein